MHIENNFLHFVQASSIYLLLEFTKSVASCSGLPVIKLANYLHISYITNAEIHIIITAKK